MRAAELQADLNIPTYHMTCLAVEEQQFGE
jgi:hypothetical protein